VRSFVAALLAITRSGLARFKALHAVREGHNGTLECADSAVEFGIGELDHRAELGEVGSDFNSEGLHLFVKVLEAIGKHLKTHLKASVAIGKGALAIFQTVLATGEHAMAVGYRSELRTDAFGYNVEVAHDLVGSVVGHTRPPATLLRRSDIIDPAATTG
jgi:hypothetical protein